MQKTILGTLVALLALSSFADAGTLYAVRESDDVLIEINTDTLAMKDIGPLGTTFAFGGLEYANGTLWMVPGRGNNNLFTVDVKSGKATMVGSHGVNDLFGLGYDSKNGVMYGTQFSQGTSLWELNTGTGAAKLVGNMGRGIGGLCYNYNTDQLIGVQDGAGDLFEINRQTAQTTLLYAGDYTNDSGLAYDGEKNVLWDIDWNGNLYLYDISNNYARKTMLSGLGAHDGLAFVPEPSALALLAVAGLLIRRR